MVFSVMVRAWEVFSFTFYQAAFPLVFELIGARINLMASLEIGDLGQTVKITLSKQIMTPLKEW